MNPKSSMSSGSWFDPMIWFCLHNKLVVGLLLLLFVVWGALVAPFDWRLGGLPRDPVPVDALPDLGENQQIVFTRWEGRSPQDVEDQITYPLTTALMGLPHLKTIRSYSDFGFSTIYLIFEEKAAFYESRSRILEKLNSLPNNTLPTDAKPTLGPDATGLGQIFWYTLEGRDAQGRPAGGWDLHETRRIQDWYIRYALQSVAGVAEVASIGGFVQEYQIDVDPEKLRVYGLTLEGLYRAVQASNQEIGARTIEINRVEYVIRARGYLKSVRDLGDVVLRARQGTPLYLRDVARIALGPAPRRGALDKDGAEAVGGVVVARYGANPLAVIQQLKDKIKEISPGLPQKQLRDGRISKLTLVPFYDRSKLIHETLGTLEEAITLEVLVTIIVVILMLMHLRSALLIAGTLPIAVLLCFIAMKSFGVDANIVALSGIAIAIGTMVDMGIVLSEQIYQSLEEAPPDAAPLPIVFQATSQVAGAVLTAVSTTIVSFLPVFTMEAAEGKLFRPLAWTKTFALLASLVVALTLIPPLALLWLKKKKANESNRSMWQRLSGLAVDLGFVVGGIGLYRYLSVDGTRWMGLSVDVGRWLGLLVLGYGLMRCLLRVLDEKGQRRVHQVGQWVVAVLVVLLLARAWMPLEEQRGFLRNALFVGVLIGGLIGFFALFRMAYATLLRFFLRHKLLFLSMPVALVLFGASVWLGFDRVFGWLPPTMARLGIPEKTLRAHPWWVRLHHDIFPGLKKEFMPNLDEGSFLLMPTTMPHASMGEALDVLKKLDMAVRSIPEVESVVGKLGRAESALDPAPISMFENVIHYKAKYRTLANGQRIRQWRPHIHTPQDIWDEIIKATRLPGTTSAPLLQPISARIVMLQSGMRAPMGIKVKGPDLQTLEKVALQIEGHLKKVPQIAAATVIADRVVGKPYLEFIMDRRAIARYGLQVADVQRTIQMAIGGAKVTTTVEGRERYDVVLRYPRELRNSPDAFKRIMIASPTGAQIPLLQLATLRYLRGPQMIKSEDTFLVAYVIFDRNANNGEIETVDAAKAYLQAERDAGRWKLPAGVSYTFAGTYQHQIRAEKRLWVILPLSLFLIFLLLYLQFRQTSTTFFVFLGIGVAWSGGFLMLWLYAQPWFLDFAVFGAPMREVFHIQAFQMSVAVWVGFIALFGIASDDGVVIATYLDHAFQANTPDSIEAIRETTVAAGQRRIRACLMTTATTLLALLPVLSSSGRGSDIMIPMAIPSFGGMFIELLTLFLVPVLYCWREERRHRRRNTQATPQNKRGLLSLWRKRGILSALSLVLLCGGSSHTHAASVSPEDTPFPPTPSALLALPPFSNLWAQAMRQNPTLQRIHSQFAVASARIKQAGAWPDLEIGIQANNFPLPNFRPNMMTGIQYSIGQKFPILGRLAAQKAIAQAEIHKIRALLQENQAKIAYEIREHLLMLLDLHLQWKLRRELYQLTQQIAAVARTRYAASTTRKQDLLLALLQLAQLRQEALQIKRKAQQRILLLQRLTQAAPASPNNLQAAPASPNNLQAAPLASHPLPTTPISPVTSASKTSLSIATISPVTSASKASSKQIGTDASTRADREPPVLRRSQKDPRHTQRSRWAKLLQLPLAPPSDLKTAWEEMLRTRPMLRYWHSDAMQARQLTQIAHARYWPEITLRLTFQQRFENSMDQGEPFLSFGIQIPLPTWGNVARQGLAEEATARFVTAQKRLRELLSDLRQQLTDAFQEIRNLREQQQLYQTQMLPLALQTYQASLASYQVGKEDFPNLLGHLKRYLALQLQAQRLSIALLTQDARVYAIQGKQPKVYAKGRVHRDEPAKGLR